MFKKALLLLLMMALLWLSGCVAATPASVSPFGPCDMRMDPKYCGP
jgi:hypothetical protein